MRRSEFQPTLTELEGRDAPDAYWATHWWTREHAALAQQTADNSATGSAAATTTTTASTPQPYWATHWWTLEHGTITTQSPDPGTAQSVPPDVPPTPAAAVPPVAVPPVVPPVVVPPAVPPAVPPVVVAPPVVPPVVVPPVVVPPVVPPAVPPVVVPPVVPPTVPPTPVATPTPGQQVLAFAQANLGQVVTSPAGTGCAALADAALAAAGAVPQSQLGTAGPVADHYVWGTLIFQRSGISGYDPAGVISDIQPGDIIQIDQYAESRPDGSWVSADHHTAIVQSVDPNTGEIVVLQQNWNGNPATTQGVLYPATMTSGVISVYRPVAA